MYRNPKKNHFLVDSEQTNTERQIQQKRKRKNHCNVCYETKDSATNINDIYIDTEDIFSAKP
jgi:hypothetical protein